MQINALTWHWLCVAAWVHAQETRIGYTGHCYYFDQSKNWPR